MNEFAKSVSAERYATSSYLKKLADQGSTFYKKEF
jgi:hypothetical protein